MAVALSFEQAPPISVPLRFLLTAPLFGIAFGAFIAWQGTDLVATRGSLPALAATHLLTLGFMLQAMCGALLQISPVAAGANVWRPRSLAWVSHVGLGAGALALVGGLAGERVALLRVAAPVLIGAMAIYAAVVFVALLRTPARGPTIEALRLAVAALVVTVVLGGMLAATFGWSLPLPLVQLAPVHAAWAVFGWALTLVAGVSYLVVPMFQLTPPYPGMLSRWLPRAVIGALCAWSVAQLTDAGPIAGYVTGMALLGAGSVFAFVTLRLQAKRRRKISDATLALFRIAMLSMLAAFVAGLALPFVDGQLRVRVELALGVLLLVGFFVSVINGMMYKIVPFIVWLHLQKIMPVAPTMNQILPGDGMRGQSRLQAAAAACLLGALLWPPLVYAGAATFAASCAWLEWNLARAAWLYARLAAASHGASA